MGPSHHAHRSRSAGKVARALADDAGRRPERRARWDLCPLHPPASVRASRRRRPSISLGSRVRFSPFVLFAPSCTVVRFLLEVLIVARKPDAKLQAEVMALRHQLRVLERRVSRPRWHPSDRLLLAAISRVLPRPAWRSLLPSPETLLRWHRGAAQEVAVPAGGSPAGVIPGTAP